MSQSVITPVISGPAASEIDMSCYFTYVTGTPTIQKSSNVSSLTDRGTGQLTAIPITNLASVNYVLGGTSGSYRKISDDTGQTRAVDGVPLLISIGGSLTDLNSSFFVTGA